MMFCWSAIYNNKRATPLGFQYKKLDYILGNCGNPIGIPVYIPFNSQGEDHLEDYLGMIGIPFEPSPEFPKNGSVFLTASALKDNQIVEKVKTFVEAGGKALVTSGFMIGALEKYPQIQDLTSIRYRGRRLDADEFQVTVQGLYGRNYVKSRESISFPLLEHRNNASWSKLNAGHGEYHESIIMFDTYGEGIFEVINLPDLPSKIRELPEEVLSAIRYEFLGSGKVWISGTCGVSLFTYDNDTFGLYCYTNDGCAPVDFNIHINQKVTALEFINDSPEVPKFRPSEIPPLYTHPLNWKSKEEESVFRTRLIPGDFQFFRIKR